MTVRAPDPRRTPHRPVPAEGDQLVGWASLKAHLDAAFMDHGVFRQLYRNWFEVVPGVFRSSQPTPDQLARAARAGVRTVINLRGTTDESFHRLERKACDNLGLRLESIELKSREAPDPAILAELIALFRTVEHPILMHCKSGADRAGLASAVYVLAICGAPAETAMRQLSYRYGHWRIAKTGVLDFFLRAFSDAHARSGISFEHWLAEGYERKAVDTGFHDTWWVSWVLDKILRRE